MSMYDRLYAVARPEEVGASVSSAYKLRLGEEHTARLQMEVVAQASWPKSGNRHNGAWIEGETYCTGHYAAYRIVVRALYATCTVAREKVFELEWERALGRVGAPAARHHLVRCS